MFSFKFSGSPAGAIVGGSVAGVIVIAASGGGVGVIVYKYRKKRTN